MFSFFFFLNLSSEKTTTLGNFSRKAKSCFASGWLGEDVSEFVCCVFTSLAAASIHLGGRLLLNQCW